MVRDKKNKTPSTRRRKDKNNLEIKFPFLVKLGNFIQQPGFILTWLWVLVSAFIIFVTYQSHIISSSLGFLMITLTAFGCAVIGEIIERRRWEKNVSQKNVKLQKKVMHLEDQILDQENEQQAFRVNMVRLIEHLSEEASVRQQKELQNIIHELGVYQGALATKSEAAFDADAYDSMTARIIRNNAREAQEADEMKLDMFGTADVPLEPVQEYELPDFDLLEEELKTLDQASSTIRTMTKQAYETLAEEEKRMRTIAEINPTFSSDLVNDMVNKAVREDRVDIFMQPVVKLPSRQIKFSEIFARLKSTDGRYIPAKNYIQKAREERLMPAIDNLVLLRAVQYMRRERGRIEEQEPFFFNLNFETLSHSSFMLDLIEFLNDNPHLPPRFILEMKQDDYERLSEETWSVVDSLGELGCRFSLDAVSNFNIDVDQLRERKMRFIKIDADLLVDATSTNVGEKAFLDFRKELNRNHVQLVVQKIEDEDTLLKVLDYDVEYGQGYLFGTPVHSNEREAA